MHPTFAFIGELSPFHWLVVLIIGVLLFGNRLPQVGRSLGKGLLEFKKGLKGLEDDIDEPRADVRREQPSLESPRPPQRVPPPAQPQTPRFEDTGAAPPPA